MNKTKQAFREAIDLLREVELEPEQLEALATIERYPGELRRQIGELKTEVQQLQQTVTAERKIGDRLQAEQIKSQLEEKLRVSEGHARLLESRVRTLEAQVPQPILPTNDVWGAATALSKQCQRIFAKAFVGWDVEKADAVLLQHAVLLVLKTCQVMADQRHLDRQLEEELLTACSNHFDRIAPGRFSWKKRDGSPAPFG